MDHKLLFVLLSIQLTGLKLRSKFIVVKYKSAKLIFLNQSYFLGPLDLSFNILNSHNHPLFSHPETLDRRNSFWSCGGLA